MRHLYTVITVTPNGGHQPRVGLESDIEVERAIQAEQRNYPAPQPEFIVIHTSVTANGLFTFIERRRRKP